MTASYSLAIEGFYWAAALMTLGWLYQLRSRDAGIVDVLWSYSLGLLAIYYAALIDAPLERRLLIALLPGFWSFRLGTYLLKDRILKSAEDGRYQALREHWQSRANAYFLPFFLAQAALSALLSSVFIAVLKNPSPTLTTWELLGAALFVVSIVGESIADKQLASFRRDTTNKGKVCQVGLWRYSRHPNYFFEWLHWMSYVVMTIATAQLWVALLVAFVMYVFLTKFTGVPYTEMQALKSRGEAYKRYQQTTSVLIPWWPKTVSNNNDQK